MNKKICSIISVLLFTFLLASISFASSINIDSNISGKNVVLTVNGTANTAMSIIVEDTTRFYYIDQKMTDESGKVVFSFTLSKYNEKNYNYKVNSSQGSVLGIIAIKDGESSSIKEKKALIKVVGYNNTILNKTSEKILAGDTVLSFSERVFDSENISYDNRNGYIASIDGQKQLDHGSKSGWMYSVNDTFPGLAADSVTITDGDYIKWLYTLNLGVDVGNKDSISKSKEVAIDGEYDFFGDKSASQAEIVDAIESAQGILKGKVMDANTESKKSAVIKEANKIFDSIVTIPAEKRTEKFSKNIIDNSIETIRNMISLIDKGNSFEVKEGLNNILEQNVGLILYLTNDIKDEKFLTTYIENIFELNNQIFDKSDEDIITNKLKTKILEISIPNELENASKFSLPMKLLDKAKEGGINNIFIKNGLTVFNITPDVIKYNENDGNLVLSSNIVDKGTLTDEVAKRLPKDSVLIKLEAKLGDKELVNFNSTIEVSLKYTGDVKNNDEVTVFLLKKDGSIEPVGGVYDAKTKTIKFLTNHFSNYFVKNESKTFNDTSEHWASNEINAMASKGIIEGKTDELFEPDEDINRAEFTVLISRMLKLTSYEDQLSFDDISKDDWYYDDIVSAFENGIIKGRSENEFNPSGLITRQEAAKIISNVLLKKNYIQNDKCNIDMFMDKDQISDWAKDDVAISVREKIFESGENSNFAPLENLTRAQAATIIYRVYKLLLA